MEKIDDYKLLLPQIKNSLKQLKNRSNNKIQRVNQVTDPNLVLLSKTDILENSTYKKENILSIPDYLNNVLLSEAIVELNTARSSLKDFCLNLKKTILNQLMLIENSISQNTTINHTIAINFFEEFSNGILNNSEMLLRTFENVVVAIEGKKMKNEYLEKKKLKKIENILTEEQIFINNKLETLRKTILEELICSKFPISAIIQRDEFQMIYTWVRSQTGHPFIFELLFNSAEHGFAAQEFHVRCDNKGPTLAVVEAVTGKRFGGFAHSAWHNRGEWITDEKSFIFSLDHKERYLHKFGNRHSTHGHFLRGPTFGEGYDFSLYNNCNSNNISCCNPNNTYDCKERNHQFISGSKNFTVKNYEVFLIKFLKFQDKHYSNFMKLTKAKNNSGPKS